MAADLQAAAEALADGQAYARRERERRIGLTHVTSGTCIGLTFVLYGVLAFLPWDVPGVVWALAWLPVVAGVTLARRRFFKHLPTRADEVWGIGDAWWLVIAAWIGLPIGAAELGHPELSWPLTGLVFGALFLLQARKRSDAITAMLGIGAVLFSLVLVLVPHDRGLQPLLLGLWLGGDLIGLGIMRVRRSER